MSQPPAAPPTDTAARLSTTRIVGVDVARGLALLGMMAAHLVTGTDTQAPGGVAIAHQVVGGRSAALFAVLAGLSIALVTRHGHPGDRAALATRAALVAGLGLFLGMFPSGVAVILCYYGVLFLVALPVLRWRAGQLALLALAWGLASPVVSLLLRAHLPASTYQTPSPMSFADPLQLGTEILLTGYYPVLTWATYLFAGMAIGRLDLRAARWGPRLLVWGAALAVAALGVARWLTGLPGVHDALVATYDRWEEVDSWADLDTVLRTGLYGTTPTGSPWWLAVWSPHSGSIVDLAHTVGTSMLVLGLCLVLVRLTGPGASRWWQIAFGAGTMTLSLYTLHVLLASFREVVPALGLLWVHVLIIGAIGAAYGWARMRGPLELIVSQVSQVVRQSRAAR